MEQELVSVIMPVFNAEKYLTQAIASILNQSYSKVEVLIFDDGSTDESARIISEFASSDKRVIPHYSTINQGYVFYLNEGIRRAKGEFVARMDADDLSECNRLLVQVNFLKSHPSVAVVGSATVVIDGEGTPLRTDKRKSSPSDLFWQSFFTNPLAHPTVMFRRSVVIRAGMYDPKKMPAEDFDLWTRVLRHAQLANISAPLVKYRIHSMSVSSLKRGLQRMHSSKSLKDHWFFFCGLDLDNDAIRFFKNYHKGHELKARCSRVVYYAVMKLYLRVLFRFGFRQQVSRDAFGKLLYLASRSRYLSLWVSFELSVVLFLIFPVRVLRKLIAR